MNRLKLIAKRVVTAYVSQEEWERVYSHAVSLKDELQIKLNQAVNNPRQGGRQKFRYIMSEAGNFLKDNNPYLNEIEDFTQKKQLQDAFKKIALIMEKAKRGYMYMSAQEDGPIAGPGSNWTQTIFNELKSMPLDSNTKLKVKKLLDASAQNNTTDKTLNLVKGWLKSRIGTAVKPSDIMSLYQTAIMLARFEGSQDPLRGLISIGVINPSLIAKVNNMYMVALKNGHQVWYNPIGETFTYNVPNKGKIEFYSKGKGYNLKRVASSANLDKMAFSGVNFLLNRMKKNVHNNSPEAKQAMIALCKFQLSLIDQMEKKVPLSEQTGVMANIIQANKRMCHEIMKMMQG